MATGSQATPHLDRSAAAEPLTLALTEVGFVVTAAAYRRVIGDSEIRELLIEITSAAATAAPDELTRLAATARDLIADVSVPDDLVAEISAMYARHCEGERVAVRSSASEADTAESSVVGSSGSFTNVSCEDLLDRVIDCWVSLYGERVVSHRAQRGLTDEPAIAVVVQKMVSSDLETPSADR